MENLNLILEDNKIKFIFTADWHLSKYNNDKIEPDNLPERLSSIKKVLYNISEYAINNNISCVVVGGDLLHNKSIIHALAQDILLDFFRNNKRLQFIVIDGNHDKADKKGEISSLKSLDSELNVTRIFQPTKIDDIFFVPYSYNMVDIIKNNSSKYLISHIGLSEGMLNSGISVVSDIKLSDLIGKYETVLLGHYHKPQEIIRDDIKLYYVGSPIELDWGERNEDKRFLLINTEIDRIENILTNNYKKHYQIEITTENREEILREARYLKEQGHHVNLIKTNNDVIVDNIKNEFNIIDKTVKDITNRGITIAMSTEEKLKKYLEIKEISDEELNNYLSIGFEIINSCMEEE